MTSAITSTPKLMDAAALKMLAGCQGPFITAIVPDHHPGAPEGSRQATFQSLIKAATEQLAASPFADRAADLLAPLQELASNPAATAGGPGLVIFRSPDKTIWYRVTGHAQKLVIASHPYLTPFVPDAFALNDLFILGLGTKNLRLFHYFHGECLELDLPKGVPANLEEAGQYNRSDPNLENRSSIGSSTGNMHAVRFGTTSDRDAADAYLRQYFGMVDRGLKSTLAGKPLLLMGVHEEIHAYRRAAKYEHLLGTDVDGSPEHLTAAEVAARARQAAGAAYEQRADGVLEEFREMKVRLRTLREVRAVLGAAAQGRVHRLCVRRDTQFVDAAESAGRHSDFANQDLVNAAVVETLRTDGEVFEVPQDRLAATEPLAAILRY